ncbi:hypothetical protein [Dokdonella sp.]|uniref:hypothetical protein n=1 Tax=Dokdonella sp. TaxID=2291710 RepID=UPI0031BBE05E|nr:hypothetical protein [Dokdonella sp.]
MSRSARQRELAAAALQYRQARAGFATRMVELRTQTRRLPIAWLLGGGFAAGMLAGLLPLRPITQAGGFAADMLALAWRMPYVHQLLGAMRRGWDSAGRPAPSAGAPPA